MDKNELLTRIKEENEQGEDPYTNEVEYKAERVGMHCAAALATLLFFLKMLLWNEYVYE